MARRLTNWILDQSAIMYKRSMDRKLRAFGLKYDDLRMEESPDVGEALKRLPKEELVARQRRLMRAFDISLKRTPLPQHIQDVQKPFEPYLADAIKQVQAEKKERELLNGR
ncbi:unnamed protein product [Discosporangium mesarthrocarpum]